MIEIRRALPEDADEIACIWNCEIRDGVSTFNSTEKDVGDIKRLIQNSGAAVVVASESGQVLGFASYGPFRNGIGYAHSVEHSVYLTAAARGRGIGRALLQRIEFIARQQGHHALIAGIGGENAPGIAFHKAMGFAEVGRLPEVGRKFDRWMDLVLMQKIL